MRPTGVEPCTYRGVAKTFSDSIRPETGHNIRTITSVEVWSATVGRPRRGALSVGIRELLIKSLQIPAADMQTSEWEDVDAEDFFVTHSLGSYLSLVALDLDLLGPQDPELAEFRITPEQRQAADHFSEHTVGFYFLANQLALLQLARISASTEGDANPLRWNSDFTINRTLGLQARALLDAARFYRSRSADRRLECCKSTPTYRCAVNTLRW